MPLRRVVASISIIAAGVALAACGKGDSTQAAPGSGSQALPTPPAPPPPPPPPAVAVSVAGQYQVPSASVSAALPAAPAAYVFVTASGAMRVGKTPAIADATEAADLVAMHALIPPATGVDAPAGAGSAAGPAGAFTGDPGAGWGTIGHGSGTGVGGPVGGGFHYTRVGLAERTDPAAARIVAVFDRAAPTETIGRVLAAISEPVAVVVDGGASGGAALGVVLTRDRYQDVDPALELTIDRDGTQLADRVQATTDSVLTAADGSPDRAALISTVARALGRPGRTSGRVQVTLGAGARFETLVLALDALAASTAQVAIRIRSVGGLRSREPAAPQVRIGQSTSVGDLDKNIIRRYIKRNLSKITYCYEKQLLSKPGLEGTVTTQFFITDQGTVSTSKASGVDPVVASCIAEVIKTIAFPRPPGGGGVQVTYPFIMRPTSG